MNTILPFNLEEMLGFPESARLELKRSWDPGTTVFQIIKTICAFANDYQNLNGGVIVLGIEEQSGRAVWPPVGLNEAQIDQIQKEIRGQCKRIEPECFPIFSPELIQGQLVLALWVPPSSERPHKAPNGPKGEKNYYVRIGSETVDAVANGLLQQLLEVTTRTPFDDRRNLNASIEDLRELKVREFLKDTRSSLIDEKNSKSLYRKLRIAVPVNGHDAPKNIGLLLFSESSSHWFPGAQIQIVQFAADGSGSVIEEKILQGGIHEQLRAALNYLENLSTTHIEKQKLSSRTKGWVSYPIPALREALVNAVYHRGYEEDKVEPIKVFLYPNRIEIISYPGPVAGIELKQFSPDVPMNPVSARNRRIGGFLKDLGLAEGYQTGIPRLFKTMQENGSMPPRFDFDEARSYFRVTLPAHPEYVAISALRDIAYLEATGHPMEAFERLEMAWKLNPATPTLTKELIRSLGEKGKGKEAEKVFAQFKAVGEEAYIPQVLLQLINTLFTLEDKETALDYLKILPTHLANHDSLEAAISSRRLGNQERAHQYFDRAGAALLQDARFTHEFAQTKMNLASNLHRKGRLNPKELATNKRLLEEAMGLLERVIQMEADPVRHAYAWRDLARTKLWLKYPQSDIVNALEKAIKLQPHNREFLNDLKSMK